MRTHALHLPTGGRLRRTLFLIALLTAGPTGCSGRSGGDVPALRVGYQKWGTVSILKASGRFETALDKLGWRVEWSEFPSGPPLLEALNADSIDIGHAGDSPPLFAQAAGVPFVYIAASSPSPRSSAILVRDDSPLRSVADLAGKRVGFTKGSSAHTMVVRALERDGLTFESIRPVYLSPADGRVSLAAGSIDAWSVWDPYFAAAEQGGGVRAVADGQGIVSGREFYFASRRFAKERPEIVRLFLSELRGVKDWAKASPEEVNRMLAEQTGLPVEAVRVAEARRNRYETVAVGDDLIAEQQALADRYLQLGLLPGRIDVRTAVLDVVPRGE